ncbi:MAG: hypothetical protein Q8N31_19835 [Reyranella sp.]|nr:hypothetical protein [Reyranella sp.]
MAIEIGAGEGARPVDHLPVELFEEVAIGPEAALDEEGFEAAPLVRRQPVANLQRDRQERPAGVPADPVESGDAGLGLLRRLLGMTSRLVQHTEVTSIPPSRALAGGAGTPHFL